jgi:hypothetical protein
MNERNRLIKPIISDGSRVFACSVSAPTVYFAPGRRLMGYRTLVLIGIAVCASP